MELYFLDESFSLIEGPVEDMTSIVWSLRYFEPGTFTFHFPREIVKRVAGAAYVRSGKTAAGEIFCGRIEYLRADSDGDCEMGGHLLECLVGDRILFGKRTWTGTVPEAILAAASETLRSSDVKIGEDNSRIIDPVSLSSEWEPLGDWMYDELRPYGASFRVTLDEDDCPVLNLVRGYDRSGGVSSQPVIFSASYGNIFSIEMEEDAADMKNYVYVEGSDGTVIGVSESDSGSRRELYKKAADITRESFEDPIRYHIALQQRGLEILAKNRAKLHVSAECDAGALPVYGTDYALGDICDVVDEELGLRRAMRLTRVDWVAENGRLAVYPVFGE